MKSKLIKYGAIVSTALFGLAGYAGAQYTSTTIPTTMGDVLDGVVEVIISTAVAFLQGNLPLIIVLGVSVGFMWYLIGKARGALRGR